MIPAIPFLLACAPLALPSGPHGRPDPVSVWSRSFGLAEIDGGLRGAGPGYLITFSPTGFAFTPALGEAAPRDFLLDYSLESIRRGETAIYAAPEEGVPPRKRENTVEFPRGEGIVELVDVRADGIEHSLRFDVRPPGSGDLVVRGRVASALLPSSFEAETEELRFALDGIGGIRFGAVMGIDAAGRSVRGWLRFDGTHLEYRLPARFVESAGYPLLLDPTIGLPIVGIGAGQNARNPDVAYDAATSTYLVVWETIVSATNRDIYGQLVSTAGTLVGGILPIRTEPEITTEPAVASVAGSSRFLVVYRESTLAGGIFGPYRVHGNGVDAATGAVSAAFVVGTGPEDLRHPDVGGDSAVGGASYAIVVWERAGAGIDARAVDVPPHPGLPTPGALLLSVSTNGLDHEPAIS
jgi:hypothetical protein